MTYKQSFLVSLFFVVMTNSIHADIEGTIRFPLLNDQKNSLITSNGVAVYQGGTKVRVAVEGHQATFSIKSSGQTVFYLLIVLPQDLQYIFKDVSGQEKHTVSHRAVVSGKPYKFFKITLAHVEIEDQHIKTEKTVQTVNRDWIIEQIDLSENQAIPDDAIIVLYNSEYIESVKPEGNYKLPTIVIDKQILQKVGSIDNFHTQEVVNLLASMDSDALHACPTRKTVSSGNCNRVMNYIG